MFAKNSSQTSQVRSRSALGSRCSLNMTIKRYKSKQSANDYATSNFTTTVTVLEIHNNMWKSFFFYCFFVPNSLSNEETLLNFPWLRVLWRNKRKLYRKPTDQPWVRTDWIASLPMAFALVSKRVTVHNLSFDGCAWLSWRKFFISQHAKLNETMWHTQACIRLVWFNHQRSRSRRCQILRITFFPCFHFRFVFLFFHEGPKWVVRWTTTASASKMSKSSGQHGSWQRKRVPTFLLQKSQTRKAAP